MTEVFNPYHDFKKAKQTLSSDDEVNHNNSQQFLINQNLKSNTQDVNNTVGRLNSQTSHI